MKIVMLCKAGDNTSIVYNRLRQEFTIDALIVEDAVPRSQFLKKRIKKQGLFKTVGQMAFVALVVPILRKQSAERYKQILEENHASIDSAVFKENAIHVSSANSPECIALLQEIKPDIVVVNGTRILSKEVLESIDAVFINMHAGITPKYRGSNGAYWAVYNQDRENAGVTVHLVDEGIDTGNILYQSVIKITEADNYSTYPALQMCAGVEDEIKAIRDVMNGTLRRMHNDLPSSIYNHPTLVQYLYHRIKYKVK